MAKIITLYKRRLGKDAEADALLGRLKNACSTIFGVEIEKVVRLEGTSETELLKLSGLFHYPIAEELGREPFLKDEPKASVIEYCYKRAWTDPEMMSIEHMLPAYEVNGFDWARLATRIKVHGVDRQQAEEIISKQLINPQTQVILQPGEVWSTLAPQGDIGEVELIDVREMSPEELMQLSAFRKFNLFPNQMLGIQEYYRRVDRFATDGELYMHAGAWGDHCKHTTWAAIGGGLLAFLIGCTEKINHRLLISKFKDNSGVYKFYGKWSITFKGETHISPTLIDPYGGILTEHGGVQRDAKGTGKGARPILGTQILATQNPYLPVSQVQSGTHHPIFTIREAIRATADYCNPMGIPMAWTQFIVDPDNVKSIALGHCCGLIETKLAQKGTPHVGDLQILIGGLTGCDGILGGVISGSAATSETMKKDQTHVQTGHPIEQRIFMEIIPTLGHLGITRAITDCGAMGLSSAGGEQGEDVIELIDGKEILTSGVFTNLKFVPLKCKAMLPREIWISESQERMVLAVPPEKYQDFAEIALSYGCRFSVIGVYTNSGSCQVVYDNSWENPDEWLVAGGPTEMTGQKVVDLPYPHLKKCPIPYFETREPAKPKPFFLDPPTDSHEWRGLTLRVSSHLNVCNKAKTAHHFDQSVQGGNVIPYVGGPKENMPDEIYAATPVLEKDWTVLTANAVNQFYGKVDTAGQGELISLQAMAKLVSAGVNPKSIVFNANVCSPSAKDPENAWRLERLVKKGYGPASVKLGTPVGSGKDSSNVTFITAKGVSIHTPITLDILSVGRMVNWRRIVRKQFKQVGDRLVLFFPGLREINLGGSILYNLFDQTGDKLPVIDLEEARRGYVRYHKLLRANGWNDHVHSRSVVCEAGLMMRLFEMSLGSNGLGCKIWVPEIKQLKCLFGEYNGAILFATDLSDSVIGQHLKRDFTIIGEVIDQPEIIVHEESMLGNQLFSIGISEIEKAWSQPWEVIE